MYDTYEKKYIELLINRCLNFKSKALFIRYPNVLESFINKLIEEVRKKGIDDIYLDKRDPYFNHDKLKEIDINDIKNDPYFDDSIWDEYAKKDSAFLMLSSVFPDFNNDIDSEKIAEAAKVSLKSKPLYKKRQAKGELSWCIAVFPNKVWAKKIFPNLTEDESYDKLFKLLMNATMVSADKPILSWNNYLREQRDLAKKLNELKIKKLHYKNKLGTDLEIALSDEAVWSCAGYDGEDMLVNMPSYEIFTSPDKRYTNGVVYSAKPLDYSGNTIHDFWLKFKDGKVVDYDAKEGKDILKGIIEGDEGSSYLGEVALVSKNSPIAKMNVTFFETCLDENASCHLALGEGFPECIKDGINVDDNKLKELGMNISSNHVDFMIGTDDLNIVAETKDGKILIFKDGEFNI